MEYQREPCPWRIVDDFGGAFTLGFVGGTFFHCVKGFMTAPGSFERRAFCSIIAIKERAPILGGSFALWGGMFSVIDCTLAYIRQKDDPWNSIISGFTTGGIVAARSGAGAMIGSAIFGGSILILLEGVGILFNRMVANQYQLRPMAPPREKPTKSSPQ